MENRKLWRTESYGVLQTFGGGSIMETLGYAYGEKQPHKCAIMENSPRVWRNHSMENSICMEKAIFLFYGDDMEMYGGRVWRLHGDVMEAA